MPTQHEVTEAKDKSKQTKRYKLSNLRYAHDLAFLSQMKCWNSRATADKMNVRHAMETTHFQCDQCEILAMKNIKAPNVT